ncbi:hypothetical protein MMC25_001281 [Agyrium rufum]|nr:hypothetical protein [Agyrium rufum]
MSQQGEIPCSKQESTVKEADVPLGRNSMVSKHITPQKRLQCCDGDDEGYFSARRSSDIFTESSQAQTPSLTVPQSIKRQISIRQFTEPTTPSPKRACLALSEATSGRKRRSPFRPELTPRWSIVSKEKSAADAPLTALEFRRLADFVMQTVPWKFAYEHVASNRDADVYKKAFEDRLLDIVSELADEEADAESMIDFGRPRPSFCKALFRNTEQVSTPASDPS